MGDASLRLADAALDDASVELQEAVRHIKDAMSRVIVEGAELSSPLVKSLDTQLRTINKVVKTLESYEEFEGKPWEGETK